MNRILRPFSAVAAAALLWGVMCSLPAHADSNIAVLILSTDRSREWTKRVRKMVRDAQLPCPYQVFFGNADTPDQVAELQAYIRALEDEDASTIVAIPLVVSPFSSAYRQWRYLLGDDAQPGFSNLPFFKVKSRSNIRFADPLSDSAAVVEILLDRAQEISQQRDQEKVVIVGDGPTDNAEYARYRQVLRNVAGRVQQRGSFKSVEGFALRDSAHTQIRQQTMDGLRSLVRNLSADGSRVLIVPLYLTTGGLEHRLGLELRGMGYVFNTKALFPDARISEWIRSQVP